LKIEKEGAIDWVTLNRPDALNSLNITLVDELLDYFDKLYFDRMVRIVVLRGAGRAFCAGLDLKESAGGAMSKARADQALRQVSIPSGASARSSCACGAARNRSLASCMVRPAVAALPSRSHPTSGLPGRARG
jgi:1,4-dihydroxy-2-naphthoyl-CoA synthase